MKNRRTKKSIVHPDIFKCLIMFLISYDLHSDNISLYKLRCYCPECSDFLFENVSYKNGSFTIIHNESSTKKLAAIIK